SVLETSRPTEEARRSESPHTAPASFIFLRPRHAPQGLLAPAGSFIAPRRRNSSLKHTAPSLFVWQTSRFRSRLLPGQAAATEMASCFPASWGRCHGRDGSQNGHGRDRARRGR